MYIYIYVYVTPPRKGISHLYSPSPRAKPQGEVSDIHRAGVV